MGLIGLATRAGKIVFGTDACLEQIIKRNAKLVIVAKDASERTIKNIKNKMYRKQCNVLQHINSGRNKQMYRKR